MRINYIVKSALIKFVILFFWHNISNAQNTHCEQLANIKIDKSNIENILPKNEDLIFKCAGIDSIERLAFIPIKLSTIAKHGPVSNKPSQTVGDLIAELKLMKAEPGFEDLKTTASFAMGYIDRLIDPADKQKHSKALTLLAVMAEGVDPNSLIEYIFSPACKGLTYQQAYQKFLNSKKN